MSDFLTRLSERALGSAQPVQPLIPSLYSATVYAANPAPLDAEPALSEESVERESESPRRETRREPSEPRPARRSAPLVPADESITPATPTPPRFEPSLIEPTAITSMQPVTEQPLLVPRPTPQPETLQNPSPIIAAHIEPAPVAAARSDSSRFEASLFPEQRPRSSSEPDTPFAEYPAERPAPEMNAVTRRAAPITPQTPFTPNADIDSVNVSSDDSAEAPINIRVTINRVEIRSVMPAPVPQAPSQRETGPTLSLNDYLQRRGGGR